MEYKTISILVLPTDEVAEDIADDLFANAPRLAGRRKLSEDSDKPAD